MFGSSQQDTGGRMRDCGRTLKHGSSQLDIRKKLVTMRITLGTGCPAGQQNLILGGFHDLTEQRPEPPGVNSMLTLLWAGGSNRWLPMVLSDLDCSMKEHLTESKALSTRIYYHAKKSFSQKKYHWDLQSTQEPAIAQINLLVNKTKEKFNQIIISKKKLSKTCLTCTKIVRDSGMSFFIENCKQRHPTVSYKTSITLQVILT